MSNEGMNQADQNQLKNKVQISQSPKNNTMEFASDMSVERGSPKTSQKDRIQEPVSERTAWH
ncbi:MAG: hypothetical protein GX072_10495 [Lysinibacillus sp.]|nr:hypothetical protein [Lysinibacillus sp.]